MKQQQKWRVDYPSLLYNVYTLIRLYKIHQKQTLIGYHQYKEDSLQLVMQKHSWYSIFQLPEILL
jgi:hypothetical protein